jgi:hypothetical protein
VKLCDAQKPRHEIHDAAPSPIFVAGITNMQRLTATVELVVNRLNYTLKIINNDNKNDKQPGLSLKYNGHIKREKIKFHTYQPRQQSAYRVVIRNLHQSEQQELVTEEIERMEHNIINVWNIRHRVTGHPLSLFFLDIELAAKNNETYHIEYLQIMRVQIEPPHQKQNNI